MEKEIICDCGRNYKKTERQKHIQASYHRLYLRRIRLEYKRISMMEKLETETNNQELRDEIENEIKKIENTIYEISRDLKKY